MPRAACAAVLFGALAGCAYAWQKTGATEAQARRAEGECADYARTKSFSVRQMSPTREVKRRVDGVLVYEYEYPPESLVQSQLFAECMEKRGYRAVRTGSQ